MKAIILAAGKGTRMLPLTADKPKVLVEVNGKPFLYYLLKNTDEAGITYYGFVLGYERKKIFHFLFQNYYSGALITQYEQKGTGHAIQLSKFATRDDDFLVVNGDNLFSPRDIRALTELEGNWVCGMHSETPEKYGVLQQDPKTGKLTKIVEKPKQHVGSLVNVGLYRFTPEIYDALEQIQPSPRGEYELTDAINILAEQGKINIYTLQDYWKDFGCIDDIEKMERFLQ